jgi:glycosyltransferase involved in cell wall biosynthesis
MTYKKLVAVTPVKNEEQFIEKCVSSVLNQTYPVLLHLVVDDSSEDRTPEIVKSIPDKRIKLIASGLRRRSKQHGLRPHLVQQVGMDAMMNLVPDWQFLLLIDGDCWLPPTYCESLIAEMEENPKLAMVGARYLKTPKKVEKTSLIHVRSSNHIIRRKFYDECVKGGRNYASQHGEILLERYAWINGWEIKTVPVTVYCGRETGITVGDPFVKGKQDYRLGTPLLVLLFSLRKPSKKSFLQFFGWIIADLKKETQYFSPKETQMLRRFFYTRIFQSLWRKIGL